MLKYKLIEETSATVIYEYYPEGNFSVAGVISYDKILNTNSIVTQSAEDRHGIYAQKMFAKIREFAEGNLFEEEGLIAWY